MTRYSLFNLAPIALLCTLSLSAESPAIQAPSTPAPSSAPAAPPRAPRPPRDVQYRAIDIGPGRRSMGPETRIAPPGMWWKNADIVQKISLTADQQKRMDDIFQQSRLQLIDLKANVEKQEVTLEPMLSSNPPDTNKVLAQIDRVASARAELEKANARMLLGIRGVLSADQWTKLQEEQRENRRFLYHFNRGPSGPGPHPQEHGPDSLMIQPGMLNHLQIAPVGPLSLLAPPAPLDLGPGAISIVADPSPADALELDINVPSPALPDLDH